jgi:hypothetical protein
MESPRCKVCSQTIRPSQKYVVDDTGEVTHEDCFEEDVVKEIDIPKVKKLEYPIY